MVLTHNFRGSSGLLSEHTHLALALGLLSEHLGGDLSRSVELQAADSRRIFFLKNGFLQHTGPVLR